LRSPAKANYGHERAEFFWGLPAGIFLIFGAYESFVWLKSWIGDVLFGLGLAFGLMALWFGFIFLGSKRGKLRECDILLDSIPWKGSEEILDVGCGPGLLAIGDAKRARSGRSVGVDIWNKSVETRNRPESLLQNAKLESVDGRVQVKEADARKLDDSSFDVVLSRAVLHHIKKDEERKTAVREMIRVLRPGGYLGLVLIDFNRLEKYLEELDRNHVSDVRILRPKQGLRRNKRVFGTVMLVARRTRHLDVSIKSNRIGRSTSAKFQTAEHFFNTS
jgi:ubiquinone/menaquinone biosynthesis C-methylase UbiE